MTPEYGSELSRALLKIALECMWIDHLDEAFEARWDHVRAAVLGEPRQGLFAMRLKGLSRTFGSYARARRGGRLSAGATPSRSHVMCSVISCTGSEPR